MLSHFVEPGAVAMGKGGQGKGRKVEDGKNYMNIQKEENRVGDEIWCSRDVVNVCGKLRR
jgi:hypothetical protein